MGKERVNTFISQNTLFVLLIGLSFIIATYIFYGFGKSLNLQINQETIMLLGIVGVFFGVRKYRDENLNGSISYDKALGACIYQFSIATLTYGIYTYYLYRTSPELQENYLANLNEVLQAFYKDSPLLEEMKAIMKITMTPAIIAMAEVFNRIFIGFIFSLLLAGILRRGKKI